MDKYIGFDIDDKKTVACIVHKGKIDVYETFEEFNEKLVLEQEHMTIVKELIA